MATLTKEQVAHIAKLARLRLSNEEQEKMTQELSSILTYVDMLGELHTDNVEPTTQVTGMTNAFRDDIVCPSQTEREDLLRCSGLPIIDHSIAAPNAHA